MGCIVSADGKAGGGKVAPYNIDSKKKEDSKQSEAPVSLEEAQAAEALAGAMVDGATEGSVFQRYSVGHTLGAYALTLRAVRLCTKMPPHSPLQSQSKTNESRRACMVPIEG